MYNVRPIHCILMYCIPTSFLASGVETLGGCCSLFWSIFSDENAPGEEEEEKEKQEGPWMAAIARDDGVCIAREIEQHSNYIMYLHVQLYHNTISSMLSDDIICTCIVYVPGSSYFFTTK